MKDSEKIETIIAALKMNPREFALSLGFDNAQIIYNILHEKNGLSNKLARIITQTFPDLVSYEDLTKGDKIQIKNEGVNIQADRSDIKITPDPNALLKNEIKQLKSTIQLLEREIQEYRNREKTFMNLLTSLNEAKKP